MNSISNPSPFSREWWVGEGGRAENSKLLIMLDLSGDLPHLGAICLTKDSYPPGNYKGFRNSVPGTRGRDRSISFLLSHKYPSSPWQGEVGCWLAKSHPAESRYLPVVPAWPVRTGRGERQVYALWHQFLSPSFKQCGEGSDQKCI